MRKNRFMNLFHSTINLKFTQIFNRMMSKNINVKVSNYVNKKESELICELSSSNYVNSIMLFNHKYSIHNCWNAEKPLIAYHLNYFDFIHDFQQEAGLALIKNWLKDNKDFNQTAWDPYPISLRIVNWIKYLNKHEIKNSEIYNSLYQQATVLFRRREYHLLTNHLFKNIVALLFAGIIFDEDKWKKWAFKELRKQLKEQLTCDNYHFELSPTYHAIFTKDLLDIYNILINNEIGDNDKIISELKQIIPDTLNWCEYFTKNNKFININDANYEGCPTLKELLEYAELLGLKKNETKLQNHHYPFMENKKIKLMIYCAEHQPSYNPAHSHDDLTSILLWYKDIPILVDTGNFCYDETAERDYSRSTKAHNCFTINSENQSEMWKSFRIGRRSKILEKKLSNDIFTCSHNGYKGFGIDYSRTIQKIDSGFEVIDKFISKNSRSYQIYFHFHPDSTLIKNGDNLLINNYLSFEFASSDWQIVDTDYYPEMFKKVKNKTVIVSGKTSSKKHSTIIKVTK